MAFRKMIVTNQIKFLHTRCGWNIYFLNFKVAATHRGLLSTILRGKHIVS